AVVGVLTSVISVYYYLRLVVMMYFRDGQSDVSATPSLHTLIALVLAALFVVQLGLYPSLIVELAQRFQ
ncbi:MAG TPA: NADH-quinone oxidoreductase subunit N, partial [Bacteroidota bacterium]